MFDPSTHFLPYQLAWITDNAKIAIGEKSRRIGWTYASAYRAVERRLKLGTNLYYTSADLSAAREFIDYCKVWANVFDAVTEQVELDDSNLMMRFRGNDSVILAGSSNPKFFRSKGGDADADEFAFHREPRALYTAMQPTSAVWDHQMRLWSTHNGEGSFFNQLVKGPGAIERSGDRGIEGLKDGVRQVLPIPQSPDPSIPQSRLRSLHTVSLLDAVAQGLVEKIKGLDAPNETIRRDFLEEIRAGCPDEDAWNEEYLCRPSSEQRALLSYALIQACEVDGGEWERGRVGEGEKGFAPALSPPLPGSPSPPLYAGYDVGRKHDLSVLWVVEKVGDVLWTRHVRVLRDTMYSAQEQFLAAFLQDRRVKRLCIDAGGIGHMLAENLVRRFGHRVEPITFNHAVKSELAMPLLRLFQDRQVRIPASSEVREDLHKIRKVVTASNNVRLEADRDAAGHADRFWALAMACHAALDTPAQLPPSIARKPLGW